MEDKNSELKTVLGTFQTFGKASLIGLSKAAKQKGIDVSVETLAVEIKNSPEYFNTDKNGMVSLSERGKKITI